MTHTQTNTHLLPISSSPLMQSDKLTERRARISVGNQLSGCFRADEGWERRGRKGTEVKGEQ